MKQTFDIMKVSFSIVWTEPNQSSQNLRPPYQFGPVRLFRSVWSSMCLLWTTSESSSDPSWPRLTWLNIYGLCWLEVKSEFKEYWMVVYVNNLISFLLENCVIMTSFHYDDVLFYFCHSRKFILERLVPLLLQINCSFLNSIKK